MADPLRAHPSLLEEIGTLTTPELAALHERIGNMLRQAAHRPCFELVKRRSSANASRCRAQDCSTRTRNLYLVPTPTGEARVALCGEHRYVADVKLKPHRAPEVEDG